MIDLDCGKWSECKTTFHSRNVKRLKQRQTTWGSWVYIYILFWSFLERMNKELPNAFCTNTQWSSVHGAAMQVELEPSRAALRTTVTRPILMKQLVLSHVANHQPLINKWTHNRSWSFSNVGVKWGFNHAISVPKFRKLFWTQTADLKQSKKT